MECSLVIRGSRFSTSGKPVGCWLMLCRGVGCVSCVIGSWMVVGLARVPGVSAPTSCSGWVFMGVMLPDASALFAVSEIAV